MAGAQELILESAYSLSHYQDSITVLGQVCCDSNGKLNVQSVLLEAGQEQGGRQVPVDLSELKEFSLFPGQVRYTDIHIHRMHRLLFYVCF